MLVRVKLWYYPLLPVATTSKQIDVAYWTAAAPHILQQRVIIDSMRGRRKWHRLLKWPIKPHFSFTCCTYRHSQTSVPHLAKIVKIWSADRWWYLRRGWSVGGALCIQGCIDLREPYHHPNMGPHYQLTLWQHRCECQFTNWISVTFR